MEKRKPGRPSLELSDEQKQTVLDAISAGVPVQVAVALVGCSHTGLYSYIRRHQGFAAEIKKATARAEVRLVGVIAKAASKYWPAAAWLLERHIKFRERWAKISDLSTQTNSTTCSPPVVALKDQAAPGPSGLS